MSNIERVLVCIQEANLPFEYTAFSSGCFMLDVYKPDGTWVVFHVEPEQLGVSVIKPTDEPSLTYLPDTCFVSFEAAAGYINAVLVDHTEGNPQVLT